MPLALFSTPLANLSAAHINELLDIAPESLHLDFKQRPIRGRPEDNQWSDWSTEPERKELAKDVVAFANAEGGWLILGIQAQREAPAVAQRITPIPNPSVLAERLTASVSAFISPPLRGLQARGIETEAGAGVIVFRIPSSFDAPHAVIRSEGAVAVHIRKNTDAVPMTMPEIQAMTLDLSRRFDRTAERLKDRSNAFSEFAIGDGSQPTAMSRISIVPARANFRVPMLYNQPDLLAMQEEWEFVNQNGAFYPVNSIAARHAGQFRPKLRGVTASHFTETLALKIEVEEDGSVEIWSAVAERPPVFYLGWLVADFLNATLIADRLRNAAEIPDAELIVTGELVWKRVPGNAEGIGLAARNARATIPARVQLPKAVRLPQYRLGPIRDISALAVEMLNDLYNAGGQLDNATGLVLREQE